MIGPGKSFVSSAADQTIRLVLANLRKKVTKEQFDIALRALHSLAVSGGADLGPHELTHEAIEQALAVVRCEKDWPIRPDLTELRPLVSLPVFGPESPPVNGDEEAALVTRTFAWRAVLLRLGQFPGREEDDEAEISIAMTEEGLNGYRCFISLELQYKLLPLSTTL